MNPRVFREYDIRGVADRDLASSFVTDLGRALGTWLGRQGARHLALGRDCRLHSPRLHDALLDGLLETGLRVSDVGVVATPLLYFACFHLDTDGGVQITGSHNPPEDNGFKILRGKSTIHGQAIQEVRALIERQDFVRARRGEVTAVDITPSYLANARRAIELGPRRFPVVVDAGNGTGGLVCAPLLRSLGFATHELYCDMDGRFPHHHPDPTVEKNMEDLRAEVARTGAEMGIALDGDADRIGVVDGKGRIIWGDQLMILFARSILAEQPGATFVSEVKCSQALYQEIARAGGRALMWKVGHSLIKAKMKEEKALLAGEMSGHIFFAHRYLGFDDAIYSAARLVELCSRSERTLAEMVDELPRFYNTPELRMDCPDDLKVEVVRRITERFARDHEVIEVDGARIQFGDGWGLVRASNTQPVLVLRFEASSPARLEEIRALVEGELRLAREEAARAS